MKNNGFVVNHAFSFSLLNKKQLFAICVFGWSFSSKSSCFNCLWIFFLRMSVVILETLETLLSTWHFWNVALNKKFERAFLVSSTGCTRKLISVCVCEYLSHFWFRQSRSKQYKYVTVMKSCAAFMNDSLFCQHCDCHKLTDVILPPLLSSFFQIAFLFSMCYYLS